MFITNLLKLRINRKKLAGVVMPIFTLIGILTFVEPAHAESLDSSDRVCITSYHNIDGLPLRAAVVLDSTEQLACSQFYARIGGANYSLAGSASIAYNSSDDSISAIAVAVGPDQWPLDTSGGCIADIGVGFLVKAKTESGDICKVTFINPHFFDN